ncbi:hypothetical protein D3C87_1859030 [compost metagenome]
MALHTSPATGLVWRQVRAPLSSGLTGVMKWSSTSTRTWLARKPATARQRGEIQASSCAYRSVLVARSFSLRRRSPLMPDWFTNPWRCSDMRLASTPTVHVKGRPDGMRRARVQAMPTPW